MGERGGGRPPEGEVSKSKEVIVGIPMTNDEVKKVVKERAPDGWMTADALVSELGVYHLKIKRIANAHYGDHPEWFRYFLDSRGRHVCMHFHPDLVIKIKEELRNYIEYRKEAKPAPEGWMTATLIASLLDISWNTVVKWANIYRADHPSWFKFCLDKSGKTVEHFHPDLIKLIRQKLEAREQAPEGWMTVNGLASILDVAFELVDKTAEPYRKTHKEWFHYYLSSGGNLDEHLHPDLIKLIRQKLEAREQAPEGWMTAKSLSKLLKISRVTVVKWANIYRADHPSWFKFCLDKSGKTLEHLHPDLIKLIRQKLEAREQAPEGWMTINGVANLLSTTFYRIEKQVAFYRETNPEWFGFYSDATRKISEFLHPDLIDRIVAKVKGELIEYLQLKEDKSVQEKLRQSVEAFVTELAEGKTPTAQEFQSLIRAVGASRCLDILYQFHPEFEDLPVEDVNGMIADYLGDFLVEKGKFKGDDIPPAVRRLPSNLPYQEGLYETLKDAGLSFYFEQLRVGKKMSGAEIVYAYLDYVLGSFDREGLKSKEFDDVIQRVVDYYESVSRDFPRPAKFVDALGGSREFPDMGQRVNMKEIAEKGRVLIADEMGLGKSASVIMAKEHLGVRCAVIVAPSNVISTWERYLSDDREQGGYYKTGAAPRVLMIDEPRDLRKLPGATYDFILISQEKMTDSYAHALQGVGFDMMVVDEVHKLKSLEGVRSPNLLRLAEKVKGDGKYLALLSGTPVPNKIEDIAIILKLLYPDEFSEMENKELVRSIINGEMTRLRSLLVPRMQLKELRQAVDMPELEEEEIFIEMSASEKDVYEVLLEEDELDAGQKMTILRKFLLNPESVDATPGIESSKIRRVSEELVEVFKRHDKVVMYVNDYMEDIVRGDLSIMADLAPAGVEVRVIHGEVANDRREALRQEFIVTDKKTLLVVSGQTADVGVDFSCADHVMFYNEPWRETDRRQQLSRVYRPGLANPLKSEAFIVKGTIEDGMHAYIWRKYVAVQKLLGGIPISNLEKRHLKEDEKSKEPNIAVNPELARYYFSSWDKMMRIFGYVKGIGEERFKEFLGEFAADYAEAYADLGNRSYQSNANRAAGTIISMMASEMGVKAESARILDLASGPEMLKQHIGEEYQDRVFSVDINKEHFLRKDGDLRVIGSVLTLPFADESFDFANYCLSFHYLDFAPSLGKLGRLQALIEMNRALKVGGKAVINLVYSLELRDFERFKKVVGELGFRVVDSYSGEAKAGNSYNSYFITLEKITAIDQNVLVDDRSDKIGRENLNGLKFNSKEGRLKDSRRVITEFKLGGKIFPIKLNKSDRAIYAEEQEVLREGGELKKKYGGIEDIPRDEVVDRGFVRILVGRKYKLFKRLVSGPGVVLVG